MSRTLFIDASTPTLYVGAYQNGSWLKLLRQRQSQTMECLFGMVKELTQAYSMETFEKVCICEGPGRLMSLRIAATAANQWASNGKERLVFNSLSLLSERLTSPVGYELRKDTYIVCNTSTSDTQQLPTLPEGTALLHSAITPRDAAHPNYDQAVEAFPTLADKLTKSTALFNPPLYAPLPYALAKNEAISKEDS